MTRDSYDSLLEGDPEIQAMLAKHDIENRRETILLVVEVRFPTLVETARQQLAHVNTVNELNLLIKYIATAPDENYARWAIEKFAA